jgi:hypothetical protein
LEDRINALIENTREIKILQAREIFQWAAVIFRLQIGRDSFKVNPHKELIEPIVQGMKKKW